MQQKNYALFSRVYLPKQIYFFVHFVITVILNTHHDRWQNEKYELHRMVLKSLLRAFLVLNIGNQVTFASPSIYYYTRVREMHLCCCPQRVTFGFV
jgi:hypothetical protein